MSKVVVPVFVLFGWHNFPAGFLGLFDTLKEITKERNGALLAIVAGYLTLLIVS